MSNTISKLFYVPKPAPRFHLATVKPTVKPCSSCKKS